MDVDQQRTVGAALCEVRLLPVGKGTRTFRPDGVVVVAR